VTLPDWALSSEQVAASAAVIARVDAIIDERRRLDRALNDYESFIYTTEERLQFNELFRRVTNETVRAEIAEVVAEHRNWLSAEKDGPLNETTLAQRLGELKDALRSVDKRAEELQKRGPAWQKLNASLAYVFETLNNTWPETKPWLTEEQLNLVWGQYNRTKAWFEEKWELQANRTDDQDPAVTAAEIDTQKLLLEWNFNSTSKIKKPTPTPVPTPAPDVTEADNETDESDELENNHGADSGAAPGSGSGSADGSGSGDAGEGSAGTDSPGGKEEIGENPASEERSANDIEPTRPSDET
jgi:hypothetical protein